MLENPAHRGAKSTANPLSRAEFLCGAAHPSQLPRDVGREVAFAGRSNAGKSSAINALAHRRSLARVSKTPGRTRQINFFELGDGRRLVDLPGYGYAKVSHREKDQWARLVEAYLARRRCLAGLVLLMDTRRPFTELDLQLLEWVRDAGVEAHLVLTKCDKLGRGAASSALALARERAADYPRATVQLFSATRRTGLGELEATVARWLGFS